MSPQGEGDARVAPALHGGRAGGSGGARGPAGPPGGRAAEGAGDQGGGEEDEGGDRRAADTSQNVPEGEAESTESAVNRACSAGPGTYLPIEIFRVIGRV